MSDIDFVLTWAGLNPHQEDNERFRDWGLLKYSFRSFEKNASWFHKLFFVTDGELPDWLNTNHPKLEIIRHQDFIPNQYLPVHNSNAIEVNFHRIPGLSECFVYWNDDMYVTSPTKETDFFENHLPKDMLALQPVIANPYNPIMSRILLNDSIVISKHFSKKENMKAQRGKYLHIGYPLQYFGYNFLEQLFPQYTGFYTVHGASPLMKHTYEEIWRLEPEILLETTSHPYRSKDDVTQYLFREWAKQKGEFIPFNLHQIFQYFELSDDNEKLYTYLKKHPKKTTCINDTSKPIHFEKVKKELIPVMDAMFAEKSSFEK